MLSVKSTKYIACLFLVVVLIFLVRDQLIVYYIEYTTRNVFFEPGYGNYTVSFTTHEGRFDISLHQLRSLAQLPISIRPKNIVVNLGPKTIDMEEFVARARLMNVEIDFWPIDKGPILKLSRHTGWILSIDDERDYPKRTFEIAADHARRNQYLSLRSFPCSAGNCLMGSFGYLLKNVGAEWINLYDPYKWGREDDQYIECMARKSSILNQIQYSHVANEPFFLSQLSRSRFMGLTARSSIVKKYYRRIAYQLAEKNDCP